MMTKAIELINNASKVAVFTHINSDGDALGSSISLKLGLEKLNKQVDLYCDDNIHSNYKFLNTDKYYIKHDKKDYDLAIVVDCPEVSRVGRYDRLFYSIPNKLVIDHHLKNDIKSNVSLVDVSAGSSGVITYRLFKELGVKLDPEMATALYTAVASDTGCFMHTNTTKETHEITAHLMSYNLDLNKINFYLFKRKTKEQMVLFANAIGNIQFHHNNQIAIAVVDKFDIKEANASYIDTVGIASYIAGINGISVAVLMTETKDNCFLVSFRSHKVDTSIIANRFNGGGHANASGCRICGKKESAINSLLEAVKKEL